MIKISTRGQYALLIMTTLAEQDSEKYTPLKILSHKHNLSVKYLEQILIQLGKAGLVTGLRGNSGGYKLSKPVSEYSVGEILRSVEGSLTSHSEMSSTFFSDAGNTEFWKDFDALINNFVDGITLESLLLRNQEEVGFEYCI